MNLLRKREPPAVKIGSNTPGWADAFLSRKLRYASDVASQPVSPTRDDLVRALANLGEGERRDVIAAAERAARQRKSHVVASWQSIRSAIGVVRGESAHAQHAGFAIGDRGARRWCGCYFVVGCASTEFNTQSLH